MNNQRDEMRWVMYNEIFGMSPEEHARRRLRAIKFARKLYFILSHDHYANCIRWEDDGMSFTVHDQEELLSELFVLERNGRKNPKEYSSFVKRLKRHSFRKLPNVHTWHHEHFRRGSIALLEHIHHTSINQDQGAENHPEIDLPQLEQPNNRGQQIRDNGPPQFADNQVLDRAQNDRRQMIINDGTNQANAGDPLIHGNLHSFPGIYPHEIVRGNPQAGIAFDASRACLHFTTFYCPILLTSTQNTADIRLHQNIFREQTREEKLHDLQELQHEVYDLEHLHALLLAMDSLPLPLRNLVTRLLTFIRSNNNLTREQDQMLVEDLMFFLGQI